MFAAIRKLFRGYSLAEALVGLWDWKVTQMIFAGLSAAIAFTLALLAQLPWVFIWLLMLMALALTISIIVGINEWREYRFEKTRVYFGKSIINPKVRRDTDPLQLERVQIGAVLENLSKYPMHYRVNSIETMFDGRVATNKNFKNVEAKIPPKSVGHFYDSEIPINGPFPMGKTVVLSIKLDLDFWAPKSGVHNLKVHRLQHFHVNRYPDDIIIRDVDLGSRPIKLVCKSAAV